MRLKKTTCLLGILFILLAFAVSGLADDKGKLNLNTATVEQLQKIPGLNKNLSEKIIQQRKENDEFVDMEELLDIDGMTPKILREIKKHVFIEPADGCDC